jgi:hypothetical protein
MNTRLNILSFLLSLIVGISMLSCQSKFERSGVVVDDITGEPVAGVTVEIYMKNQVKDSLQSKVSSRKDGTFRISEKRPKDQLFLLEKSGYISHVSSLPDDTIRMLKIEYYNK